MIRALLLTFALPLAITLAVELSLAPAFGLRTGQERTTLAIVNVATNPTLNFVLALLAGLTGAASLFSPSLLSLLVVLEAGVVLVEWRLLMWATRGGRPVCYAHRSCSISRVCSPV